MSERVDITKLILMTNRRGVLLKGLYLAYIKIYQSRRHALSVLELMRDLPIASLEKIYNERHIRRRSNW